MAKNEDQVVMLEQTKSTIKLRGIVGGLTKKNAYREGTYEKGKLEGKDWRQINFSLQTSKFNRIFVTLRGNEQDFVYPYKKGKDGEKGTTLKNYSFDDRHDLPEGYTLFGVNMYLEKDDEGENVRTNLIDFDAVEYLYDNLNDGDSVFVKGEIVFSSYMKDEEKVDKTEFKITSISRIQDIDFDAEDFKEMCSFEQDIVFIGSDVDKKEGVVYVTGRTIGYNNRFNDAVFVIRPEEDEQLKKLANVFGGKTLKFGDFMTITGLCLNLAETVEEDEVPVESMFGGYTPNGFEKRTVTNYINELRMTGAIDESYVKRKYKESDFEVPEFIEKAKDNENPLTGLKTDVDDSEDINDEDLPF
ncbi:hypothetical protein M5X17_27975 [Paenibacillus alvei]|uniref:hypothetical protein n=1 Tax=Paenibacillus alvei TaxID=44250 RepID=UPI00227E9F49|nr:hypothetical protein [Paenibacillus alvei]MCY9737546.1 hypothetical protein [Paenibacillus alvei]